jgi:hypothetical protein
LGDQVNRALASRIAPTFSKSSLPSAIPAGQIIYVPNEAGGAVIAFSDGAAWRRVTDRNVVS